MKHVIEGYALIDKSNAKNTKVYPASGLDNRFYIFAEKPSMPKDLLHISGSKVVKVKIYVENT